MQICLWAGQVKLLSSLAPHPPQLSSPESIECIQPRTTRIRHVAPLGFVIADHAYLVMARQRVRHIKIVGDAVSWNVGSYIPDIPPPREACYGTTASCCDLGHPRR